jgi:hypothetical protein
MNWNAPQPICGTGMVTFLTDIFQTPNTCTPTWKMSSTIQGISVMCATEWVNFMAPKDDISWHAVWCWANQMWSRWLAKNMQTDRLLLKSWVFCRVQCTLNSGIKRLTVMNKSPTLQARKNYNYSTTFQSVCVYISSSKYRNEYIHSLLKSCVRLISTLSVASKTSRITVPADTLSAGFVTGYNGISASQWR